MRLIEKVTARFLESEVTLPCPLVSQETDFSCGSAALFSVLRYWKGDIFPFYHEAQLWPALGTTEEKGTEPSKIVQVAKEYGLQAFYVE